MEKERLFPLISGSRLQTLVLKAKKSVPCVIDHSYKDMEMQPRKVRYKQHLNVR